MQFLIGVDGGGTGTRARVQTTQGRPVGFGQAGPSGLAQGVAQAWRHVTEAVEKAFTGAGHAMPDWTDCALALGLAGANEIDWRNAFIAASPRLGRLVVDTDVHAALIGAHAGRPGAVVAFGTGSVGEALRADGSRACVGGWGFPVGDEGSGAWIGLRAMAHAQRARDGRDPPGVLAHAVWRHAGHDRVALQHWCALAGQAEYASLAPMVFDSAADDRFAAALLERAAAALAAHAAALDPEGTLPLAVTGSIGLRLATRLSPALRARIVEPAADAAAGALRLLDAPPTTD